MIGKMPFNIASLHAGYAAALKAGAVVDEVFRRIDAVADPGIFLAVRARADIEKDIEALGAFDPSAKPLWGIPFCVKDNIDVAGIDTTAACPAYTYQPDVDAFCVHTLREAGAILVGKTNLDQFATGLVGVRTPYPVPKNAIDPTLVPGGSSSGSAVAVAHGIVTFSLGTDTAGSGRVPAALNNIVGLKPSLGALSATGVVPACRTLDTVSIFALNVDDAYDVASVAARYDQHDAFARDIAFPPLAQMQPNLQIGIPSLGTRQFFDDAIQARSFERDLELLHASGAELIEVDFGPFYEVAELLYFGSWVAERYTVVADLLENDPDAVHPATRKVIEAAQNFSAADAFRDQYKLADLRRRLAPVIASVDLMCVPSIPTVVRLQDIEEDPIAPNSRLGTYTNFVNLLDLCGIAVPTGPRDDGLPGSVTLLAPSGHDARAATLARDVHILSGVRAGATAWEVPEAKQNGNHVTATEDEFELAVVGAHMSGLPLNVELTRLGARFLRTAQTKPGYRLFALAGEPPARPGLVCDASGESIELETWAIPRERLGEFVDGIPHPLGIGTITLETNEQVKGFICESVGLQGATEVTEHGGWRYYLASRDTRAD
jgi:allophanate hydrolase